MRESRRPKNDNLDAFGLAEQLRSGATRTRVYKKRGQFRRLGQLAKAYDFVVGDTARVKNRIKSVLSEGSELPIGAGGLREGGREE